MFVGLGLGVEVGVGVIVGEGRLIPRAVGVERGTDGVIVISGGPVAEEESPASARASVGDGVVPIESVSGIAGSSSPTTMSARASAGAGVSFSPPPGSAKNASAAVTAEATTIAIKTGNARS